MTGLPVEQALDAADRWGRRPAQIQQLWPSVIVEVVAALAEEVRRLRAEVDA